MVVPQPSCRQWELWDAAPGLPGSLSPGHGAAWSLRPKIRCSWSCRVTQRGPGGLSLVTRLGQGPQLSPRGSWLQRARGGPGHSPCPQRHDPQPLRVLESLRQPLLGEPSPVGDSDAAGRRARGHRRTETTKEAKLWSLGTRWWWPGATQGRATPQPCAPRGSKQGDRGGGHGDRGGGPAVSPQQLPPRWPRGHGKGCAWGQTKGHPAPVPSRSRHGDGDGDEPPQPCVPIPVPVPITPWDLPDAGVPPGRAAAPRLHAPGPAAPGTASKTPTAPRPASASRPRWYRGHKAPLWLLQPRA